jgi:hypothetical protein
MSRRVLLLVVILSLPGAAWADNAKLFAQAKDAFGRNDFVEAAALCWRYISTAKQGAEKIESAQFYLAASLEKLGYYHGAVEYYFQVANNRQTPELLPRALRALEGISLERPFDEPLILRDLVGDTDFGALQSDLADFVYYWQGMTNLDRGLDAWATERFNKISRRGYYFFTALYVNSVRLLSPHATPEAKEEAVKAFAYLFGPLDLVAALDSLRRRGEADSKLAYSLRALVNDDGIIEIRADRLPKGWPVELCMLGLARVAAETGTLLTRAGETDEEALGLPLAYAVNIGGMPIYNRAIPFEERSPAIRAVSARLKGVRDSRGKALHSLARLLYEQKQYAATYNTLGTIPKGTGELSSEILLERAWSKYRSGDPHRAMGLLYALDAPVYRNLFAPEKYVLRGLIYRRFCHFRAAKVAARRFRTEFGQTLIKIREGVPLEDIAKVREAALRRVQSRKLHLFNRSLRQELASIKNRAESWNAALVKQLRKLYEKKSEQVKVELTRSLEASTREVAEDMLDAEEQVNLLEYEVGQAIFQRLSESGSLSSARKRAAKIPLSSERVYYKFSGEYWTDELPHYKFNIEDRCVVD